LSNSHITQQSKFIHPTSTHCLIVLKKIHLLTHALYSELIIHIYTYQRLLHIACTFTQYTYQSNQNPCCTNRSKTAGYRIRPWLTAVVFRDMFSFQIERIFFNLRKLSEFESKSGLLIIVSVLKPLVLATSPNFA